MADKVVLVTGTRKGLFLLTSDHDRDHWEVKGPFVSGTEVNHATIDPRTGTVMATANDPWFGHQLACSTDLGESWSRVTTAPRFPEGGERTVERLWRIEPGRASEPGVLWCGVDPASLFRSEDGGETWQENDALNTHATREQWSPGAGGLIVHSILLDEAARERMWVAISAAGVFRSDDGGATWQPSNTGIKDVGAKYDENLPTYPEVGQCVHHLVHAGGDNDRLYAQGHWGTYRSDNAGATWTEITEGLPSDFGMVIAAHPHDADTAYVLPLQGGEFRCPPEGKLRVYRTTDAGKSWQAMTQGLPQANAYMGIYREGMTTDRLDEAGVYFGTNTGQVYFSADNGDSWRRITADLPPISSLNVAVV